MNKYWFLICLVAYQIVLGKSLDTDSPEMTIGFKSSSKKIIKDDLTILILKYKKKTYLVIGMTDSNPESKYSHISLYFKFYVCSCSFLKTYLKIYVL